MIQKRLPVVSVDQVVAVEVCDDAFVTGCRSTVSSTIVITMVSEININVCKNAFTYRC